MVRVGVLGAGFMGATHVRALAALPDVHVTGVYSRHADKAAKLAAEVGASSTTDAHALINDPGMDAVTITLPTYLHAEYAIAALRAGKHVLLEKPMALTLDECDAISAAAESSGCILMLEHTLRFWPEYAALVEYVQSGALGKPLSAVAHRLITMPGWGEWFTDASLSGGAVLDLHIHDLDALNWLFGSPRSIYTRGQRGGSGGWDAAMSLVNYDGVSAFAEGNATMPENYPFSCALAVRCEHGAIEYTVRAGGEQVDSAAAGQNSLLLYRPGAAPERLPAPSGDPYAIAMETFVRSICSELASTHGTPAQGRLAVQTALAARLSIETGEIVHF